MIIPEPGNIVNIAKALLSVADHPHQVRYVSSPQAGFEVPLELFNRFDAGEPMPMPVDAEVPKKRGRPKKTTEPVVGTDDNSEEE